MEESSPRVDPDIEKVRSKTNKTLNFQQILTMTKRRSNSLVYWKNLLPLSFSLFISSRICSFSKFPLSKTEYAIFVFAPFSYKATLKKSSAYYFSSVRVRILFCLFFSLVSPRYSTSHFLSLLYSFILQIQLTQARSYFSIFYSASV